MRILISNDDGIEAEGICALYDALSSDAELVVVAPDCQRSASSHGISLHQPLRIRAVDVPGIQEAYATSGTPVDCVKWALSTLHRKTPFDMMLSGINAGANLASDVLYSGTVAAAGEAALQGVPSIAFSAVGPPFDFRQAAVAARRIFQLLNSVKLPKETFLNVNFPTTFKSPEHVWTVLGVRKYHDKFAVELDDEGNEVYRYDGEIIDEKGDGTNDIDAVAAGYISITPLQYRFMNEQFYAQMKS